MQIIVCLRNSLSNGLKAGLAPRTKSKSSPAGELGSVHFSNSEYAHSDISTLTVSQ